MLKGLAYGEKLKRTKRKLREARAVKVVPEKKKIPDSLLDAIPVISPGFKSPDHLEPLNDPLSRLGEEALRLGFTVPPQHWKTQTVLHALAKALAKNPKLSIIYVTYNQSKANEEALKCQEYAIRAGVKPHPRMQNIKNWKTLEGGGLHFFGREVGITGVRGDIVVFDDLFKGLADYQSESNREKSWEVFLEGLTDRTHEKSSVLLFFTRWGTDDVIGRALKAKLKDFKFIRIPALADGLDLEGKKAERDPAGREIGEPLLKTQKSKESLLELRDNPATSKRFWSLYQGLPTDEANRIFKNVYYYDKLPETGYTRIFAMDCAYSKRSSADQNVLIWGRWIPSIEVLFIEDAIAKRCSSDEWDETIKHIVGRSKPFWRGSGVEKGISDLFSFRVQFETVTLDKRANNEPAAKAWNEQKILVPNPEKFVCTWLDELLEQLDAFTGLDPKEHDDFVDALGNLYEKARRTGEKKGGVL